MNDKFHMTLEENVFLAKKLLVESIYNPPGDIAEFNRLLKYYYDTNDDQELKKFVYETAIINFDTKKYTP